MHRYVADSLRSICSSVRITLYTRPKHYISSDRIYLGLNNRCDGLTGNKTIAERLEYWKIFGEEHV